MLNWQLFVNRKKLHLPWRRGTVVIASASLKEDPGFESRQGVMFSGLKKCSAVFKTVCALLSYAFEKNFENNCIKMFLKIIARIFYSARGLASDFADCMTTAIVKDFTFFGSDFSAAFL
jgi:hypothetical protein